MAIDFPSSPTVNQVFSSGGYSWTWNGTKWVAVTGTGGTYAQVYVSDTAPANPTPGQLWFKSDTGVMYLRYVDVDGAQWITAIQPSAAGPQGPPGQWVQITQAAYNALGASVNPTTLYVIVG